MVSILDLETSEPGSILAGDNFFCRSSNIVFVIKLYAISLVFLSICMRKNVEFFKSYMYSIYPI